MSHVKCPRVIAAPGNARMKYEITTHPGYLRATLFRRETVEETRQFMHAVARECRAHGCLPVLVDIRGSRPIFHVDGRRFFAEMRRLALNSDCRIALLGDTPELRLSNEYLALLARQQGLSVESYAFEVMALRSLTERREPDERR